VKRQRRDHVLATILYTDIVGSSRLAADLGDRRWRVLLARHHAIVRKELKRYRGREIDNAGDGFLASFSDQERAIRCACAIVEAVRTLGIEIRAGLHVGQAEVLGRKLGGVVVNTGARVMSEAGPGQVLVTGVLKDLVPGSGFTFEGLGARELKGIAGRWPLYAVTGVDGNPRPPPPDPSEAERLRDAIKAPPIAQRRWGRLVIAGLALAIASTTAAIIASREPPIEIRPNSLLRIDPTTGEVVGDIPLQGFGSPPVAVPPNEIWITDKQRGVISVVDIDRELVRIVGGFDLGPQPVGLTFASRSLWARGAADAILELSPSKILTPLLAPPISLREYLRPIRLARVTPPSTRLTVMAAGYGRVWIVAPGLLRLFGIDPRTHSVVLDERIAPGSSTGLRGVGLAIGEGSVWVSIDNGMVFKVDPETGDSSPIKLTVSKPTGGNTYLLPAHPSGIAFGFGTVWVADGEYGVLYRIAPASGKIMGEPVSICETGASVSGTNPVSGVTVAGGRVWVACPRSKTVVRIDPTSGNVDQRIPVFFTPGDMTTAYGDVWVTLEE
jgi:class 3 adenylate cyclase/streptogramin lyase